MSEANWLADQFLRSVEGEAWHGPSLVEALQGVSHTVAALSPGSGRHGIWQLLLHLGVWVQASREGIGGVPMAVNAEQDWPAIGEVTEERWSAAIAEFRREAGEFAAVIRALTAEDFKRIVPGREFNIRFLVNGVVQHTAYHTGQIALLRGVDGKREMLRHTLATLVYRGKKAISGAPDTFATFRAGESLRTPIAILGHIGDLLDWALCIADGKATWRESNSGHWEKESARFFAAAEALDARLAASATVITAEKIFQGPIADAINHVGQIAFLRRLAEAPIRGENYYKAKIETGRVGADQAAAVIEFD